MRTSFWRRTFAEARKIDGWYLVDRTFKRSTAQQVCSDIRGNRRVAGIAEGEQWEAEWYPSNEFKNCDATVRIVRIKP